MVTNPYRGSVYVMIIFSVWTGMLYLNIKYGNALCTHNVQCSIVVLIDGGIMEKMLSCDLYIVQSQSIFFQFRYITTVTVRMHLKIAWPQYVCKYLNPLMGLYFRKVCIVQMWKIDKNSKVCRAPPTSASSCSLFTFEIWHRNRIQRP